MDQVAIPQKPNQVLRNATYRPFASQHFLFSSPMQDSSPNIILGADQSYFPGLLGSVYTTLLSSRSPGNLRFHVVDGGINDRAKRVLQQVLADLGNSSEISWIQMDLTQFSGLLSMYGNYLEYARLVLPQILDIHRAIWLDSDLLVFKPMEELWEWKLNGNAVAARKEEFSFASDVTNMHSLGIPADSVYYNSGVMVMDFDQLRNLDFTTKAVNYLSQNEGKYKWHDQSAINVILHQQIDSLPTEFNYTNQQHFEQPNSGVIETGDYIYHFLTRPKPWQQYCGDLHSKLLYKILHRYEIELPALKNIGNVTRRLKWKFPRATSCYYALTPRNLWLRQAMQSHADNWQKIHRLLEAEDISISNGFLKKMISSTQYRKST